MEKEATNIILGKAGPSDSFTLKYGWFAFKLKIKPLSARQIVEISGHVSLLKEVDTTNDMFPEMLDSSGGLWHISKVIAIATGTRFKNIVARGIMKLDLTDIQTLINIVKKQSDPERFFFILASVRGLNKMKKKEKALP